MARNIAGDQSFEVFCSSEVANVLRSSTKSGAHLYGDSFVLRSIRLVVSMDEKDDFAMKKEVHSRLWLKEFCLG
jgi:hypothetical protein